MAFSILQFELTSQVLIAESMFLYNCRRRERFLLRLMVSLLLCIVYSALIYMVFPFDLYAGDTAIGRIAVQAAIFVRVTTLIGITVVAAAICFNEDIWSLVAVCMTGYVVQHFAFKLGLFVEVFIPMRRIFPDMHIYHAITNVVYYVPVYIAMYFILARPAVKQRNYIMYSDRRLNILSVTIILALIIINRFMALSLTEDPAQLLVDSLYGMMCCLLALFIQFSLYRNMDLHADYVTIQALLKQSAQQYEQWKASVDDMNIHYHDLKHELEFIKSVGASSSQIEHIERMLNDYSVVVHTGSEELDVLLAGKKLLCCREDIQFICIADGDALNAFDGMGLYPLFNNAFDNAIESLKKVPNKEDRVMSMTVSRFGEAAIICIDNYFDGELALKDGLPISEKDSTWHGFGMKSMKRIAENMGGIMAVSVSGKIFRLEFILPYPEVKGRVNADADWA